MLVRRGLRGKMLEIVFSGKIISCFILFYPKTYLVVVLTEESDLILVIAEVNCMT